MKKRVLATILPLLLASLLFSGCQGSDETKEPSDAGSDSTVSESAASGADDEPEAASENSILQSSAEMPEAVYYSLTGDREVKFSSYDLTDGYDTETATIILLDGDTVSISGEGVTVENDQIFITQGGTYLLEGSLTDGQIVINAGSDDKVQLVLNNVSLYFSRSAPLMALNADKVILTLADGSQNEIRDYYLYTDETANACVYSECDLTINGSGSLEVVSNFNNGIATKDDLKIVSGTIQVTAANNGLKGKDSVSIIGGTVTVESKDDGIKSSNEKSDEKGFIYLGGGTIQVSAGDDSLQASHAVIIENCQVYSRCYGKKINCDGTVSGEDLIKEWM